MSSSSSTKEAPAAVGVSFACKGGCGRVLPLRLGFLVTDPALGVRAVLCEPCTSALVIARGQTKGKPA